MQIKRQKTQKRYRIIIKKNKDYYNDDNNNVNKNIKN